MIALLLADLRALANLATTRLGRRSLFGTGVGLVLLATISWWFAATVLDHPQLQWRLLRGRDGAQLQGLLGYGLMACPLVATWLGLSLAQRQLFEAPELMLWRQAPMPGWRGPLQVFVRASFLSSCWACALAGPFLVAVMLRNGAPRWSLAVLPLAIAGATVPLLGTLLAIQIVLQRFFAGRWLRLVLAGSGALASVGFSTWLLLTLFRAPSTRAQAVAAVGAAPESLPWTVDLGAEALAAATQDTLAPRAIGGIALWLLAVFCGFRLTAQLHARAHERHLAAEPPLWRSRGPRWPAHAAATVRNKEFAQVLQQPGALVSFLVFGVLVFALARQKVLVGAALDNPSIPLEVAQFGGLCGLWFLAVLLVLYAHMGRLVLWDSAQWPLYVAAPVAPGALLRGKLVAIGAFLLWPLLLVAAAGAVVFGIDGAVLLAFLGTGLGGTLAAVGVLAVVGTLPLLMRPDDSGQVVQGGRSFLAALVLVVAFQLTMLPGALAWSLVVVPNSEHRLGPPWPWAPWLVAAAIGYGAVAAGLGGWIGARNFRRLLQPR